MKDWARWFETTEGYSSTTIIHRMIAGELKVREKMGAELLPNLDPPEGYLRKLIHAMRILGDDPKKAKYITATQLVYLLSQRQASELLEKSQPTISRYCERGEQLIENYLREN